MKIQYMQVFSYMSDNALFWLCMLILVVLIALAKGKRKICPHCKSDIPKAASVCQNCGKNT